MSEVTITHSSPVRQLRSASHLTFDQTTAIRAAVRWYRDHAKPYFQINGLAGTGKTSIIPYIIDDLGLDSKANVLYGAYTGKAARVLSTKGLNAATLHSLCYQLVSTKKGQMIWKLNEDSPIFDAALLVVDECSMLNERLLQDILSFHTPVIFLGDHGQLPPIEGLSELSRHKPDAVLEQIHRQAADNPIIRLAHEVRSQKSIRFGDHGTVRKIRRHELDVAQMLAADQVICATNNTRLELNNQLRHALAYEGEIPCDPAEKILCLKNSRRHGIRNGEFLSLDCPAAGVEYVTENEIPAFSTIVHNEDGQPIHRNSKGEILTSWVYAGHFLDHAHPKPLWRDQDWKVPHWLVEPTWGYAITCHKAQGSQWDRVVVLDEKFGLATREYSRWMYTAVTRASESLLIAS